MLGRVLRTWGIVGRTFGAWFLPLGSLFAFCVLRTVVFLGRCADRVIYPGLHRLEVKQPIVVVGNPRSGTTFLHRTLAAYDIGVGTQLYEMLFPSRVLQWFLGPFLPLLERLSPARHHMGAAHQTSLTSIETDDAALLMRYLDGFLWFGFFLAWDVVDHRATMDPRQRDTSQRDFAWWHSIWQRSLARAGGGRIVAKPFTLTVRLPRFFEAYPDAKAIYMVRDPLAVIPSTLSLLSGPLDLRFGFWNRPPEVRARWVGHVVDGIIDLYRGFHEDWTEGRLPKDRVFICPYTRLVGDFEGVMTELLEFLGETPDAALVERIREQAAEQTRRVSGHKYDLDRFGLDEDWIRAECGFVYDTFLETGS
jgi:hypothetical protein